MTKNDWKTLKYIIKGLFCIFVLICFFVPASAKEGLGEKRTVRVAFPTQSGMSEVGESGDLLGYNYLYLQSLAEYAGWNMKYITYDNLSSDEAIMQAMEDVMSGKADILGPMLRDKSVEEMFAFPSNNYGIVYTTLCSLENSNLTSVTYTHCNPLRVAIYSSASTRNEEVKNYLDQLEIQYELVQCDTTQGQLEALENGDADVLSSITLSYFEGTRTVAQFASRPYYFVSSKENTELINEMDKAIDALNYTQPELQEELQNKYFGNTSGGYVLTKKEEKYLESINTLNVLSVSNYAPYCSEAADGSPTGLLVSLLNDFAQDNKIKLKYSFCKDADDLEKEWKTGKYDCVMGIPFTPEYCIKNNMIRTTSVINTNMEIYGQSQTKAYRESSIAVYSEFANQMDLDSFDKVVRYPSLEECLDAVYKGEVDYGCMNQLSVDYEAFERGYSFIATPLLGEQLNIGFAVRSDMDNRFLSIINKYITTLPHNTVTAYLSEASRHENIDPFALFLRKQPLTVALIIASILVLIIVLITFIINNNKKKKWALELQTANDAMQKAMEAKSEFLSRMSHDIRTPMNAILGFAELSKEDMAYPERLQEDLDKISMSGEFLLGLVNDILDMTKIENNAMELKPEPYLLSEFEEQLKTLVKPICNAKNISFKMNFDPDIPKCFLTDKLRFNQIFFNLLSNAVKFTKENGHVEVEGTCLNTKEKIHHIHFFVKDDGIGMSEDFQKNMFDLFSQEQKHIDTAQGSGIGLPIVKSLVALMGGDIKVNSVSGKGTCFCVSLNLESCDAPDVEEASKETIDEDALKGKKVLLCEDNPINKQLACRVLEMKGVFVDCAENGKEGVQMFKNSQIDEYDLILMDIRMPVMDGITATREIRALERKDAQTVMIVAMTANAFSDDVRECLEAGMNAHLAKPFDIKKLYNTVAQNR